MKKTEIRTLVSSLALLGLVATAPALLLSQDMDRNAVIPTYDAEGRLQRPAEYERWILVGSSMGLSYSEGSGGSEMFHETLMEPTAYDAYVETGEFRDGTMLALLLHPVGESVLPQRRGRVAGPVSAVEMAVKDSTRFDEGWAYYHFGAGDDLRDQAEPFGRDSCFDCHAEHASQDNVFVQFYPMLTAAHTNNATSGDALAGTDSSGPPLALGGLDPVHLVRGREEPGKPEIVETFEGYTYQFVSEPSRASFAADPARFAFQNDTCLMVPGAALAPSLHAVHDGLIYGFASPTCVDDFLADPEAALANEPEGGDATQ